MTAALAALAGRPLTQNEQALATSRQDAALAASLSVGRTRIVPHPIGIGTVLAVLGPEDGAALLDALDTLRANNRPLAWAWRLLEAGQLDIGMSGTRDQLQALVAACVVPSTYAEALMALAVRDDPIPVDIVSDLLNSEA